MDRMWPRAREIPLLFPHSRPELPRYSTRIAGLLLLLVFITLPPSLKVLEDGYKRTVRVISRLLVLLAHLAIQRDRARTARRGRRREPALGLHQ